MTKKNGISAWLNKLITQKKLFSGIQSIASWVIEKQQGPESPPEQQKQNKNSLLKILGYSNKLVTPNLQIHFDWYIIEVTIINVSKRHCSKVGLVGKGCVRTSRRGFLFLLNYSLSLFVSIAGKVWSTQVENF